jgi:homospermidine synthase
MVSQIVFVGFGAVARCLFVLLPKKEPEWISLPILIIDPRDDLKDEPLLKIAPYTNDIVVVNDKIDKKTVSSFFDKYVKPNAIVFDLSFRVHTGDILSECDKKNCIYANTSIDNWDHARDWNAEDMESYSLAYMRNEIDVICKNHRTTAILNHGMNPGLVSHFAKIYLHLQFELQKQMFLFVLSFLFSLQ